MYSFRRTNAFSKFCNKLCRKNKSEYDILRNRFHILLENPYNNTKFLKGSLKGKRSARDGDMRFVFAVCEECRKFDHTQLNSCANCGENPDSTIVFFAVGSRKNIYDS